MSSTLNAIKFIQEGPKVVKYENLPRVMNSTSYILFPNGTKTANMLDTLIATTGMKVEGYTPNKIVDFLA